MACCLKCAVLVVILGVALLRPAQAQALSLLPADGWSGPVTWKSERLEWSYLFKDPAGVEDLVISHPLPADMSAFHGFRVRVHLDSPLGTVFKIRFCEKDGDAWEWAWWPDAEGPGWREIVVADFQSGGSGPWPWSGGDRIRDHRNMSAVELHLTDEPDRRKVGGGTIQVSEFRFLGKEESEATLDRMADIKIIGQMEDPAHWWGPRADQISLCTEDKTSGNASTRVLIDLDPGEHLRLERVILRGDQRVDLDLTSARSIAFSWKMTPMNASLSFQLFDRSGGWLEWPIKMPANPGVVSWRRTCLGIPTGDRLRGRVDLRRIAGFAFIVKADAKPVKATLLLDDLKLSDLPEPVPSDAAAPIEMPVLDDYSKPISAHPRALHSPLEPKRFHIIVNGTAISIAQQEGRVEVVEKLIEERATKYRGIAGWELTFGPEDPATAKRNLPKVREAVLASARYCEGHQIPFYLQVSGPGGIATPLELAEDALDAAPQWCQGFWMGETPIEEYPDGIDYTEKLLELAHGKRKHVGFHRFTQTWWQFGFQGDKFERIFAPRFRDTLVPLWEIVVPSCEGLGLASVLGFWRAGRSAEWGSSVQSWWWDNMRLGGTNDMPAHNWMRMFVQIASLGATFLQIEPEWSMTGASERALHRFSELISSGALIPAAGCEQVVSLPVIALQSQQSSFVGEPGLFRPAPWAPGKLSEQLPRDEVFRKLYRSAHYYDQIFPIDRYGLVSVLPPGDVPLGLRVLRTDGLQLFEGDKAFPSSEAQPKILAAFQEAAGKLPFTSEDCLLSAIRIGKSDYQVVLIDPEERFPKPIKAKIKANLRSRWKAYDAINGKPIDGTAAGLPAVMISAGGYRIIRIEAGTER